VEACYDYCKQLLEGDNTRPKRDLRGAEGGAAHSKAQGRRDKSVPREGMLLFRGEGGEWLRTIVRVRRKDLTWGYKMPQGQLYIQSSVRID